MYLKNNPGADSVEGDAKEKTVKVTFQSDVVTIERLQEMFKEIGFNAYPFQTLSSGADHADLVPSRGRGRAESMAG